MQKILFEMIQNCCYSILDTKLNTNVLNNFYDFLKWSILTSILISFIYGVYCVYYKQYSLKGYIKEYRNNFIQMIIGYISFIVSLYFLDDLLIDNIGKYKNVFKLDTIQNMILLLLFTLIFIILIFRQLTEIVYFLLLLIFQPFIMFKKEKIKKIQQLNIELIINSCFLSCIYFLISNVNNLNGIILVFLLIVTLNFKPQLFFNKHTNTSNN